MKKIAVVIVMIICCFQFVYADITIELNKAYDKVKSQNPEFINKLIDEGANESDIRSFITELGQELSKIEGLNKDNIELNMVELIKNILTSGRYNNLQNAINKAYFNEITYMLETGELPKEFKPLKDILLDCVLNPQTEKGSNAGAGTNNGSSNNNNDGKQTVMVDLNQAYNVISITYPEFIQGIIIEGVTEEEIRNFMNDIGTDLLKIKDLDKNNFESSMKKVLYNVLMSGKHNNLQNALQRIYFDEILEMMTTGEIPEKLMPLKETFMACILDRSLLPQLFYDVDDSHWAKQFIEDLAIRGVVNGKGNRMFEPEGYVTREEFVKMLVVVKNLNLDVTGVENPFLDVTEDQWYYPYVLAAYRQGFITGISSNTFGIGQSIHRQDAAVILARVLNASNGLASEKFLDDEHISEYAKDSVYALCERGIISGMDDNSFNPMGPTTRAQAAKILSAV